MNMDVSVRSSDSKSTAGSCFRTGVNSKIILGPWVRAVPDDSVVCTVDGGDVAYDSTLSIVDGGDVGLYAGESLSLPSVSSSAPGIPSKIFLSLRGVRGVLFNLRFLLLTRPWVA